MTVWVGHISRVSHRMRVRVQCTAKTALVCRTVLMETVEHITDKKGKCSEHYFIENVPTACLSQPWSQRLNSCTLR